MFKDKILRKREKAWGYIYLGVKKRSYMIKKLIYEKKNTLIKYFLIESNIYIGL